MRVQHAGRRKGGHAAGVRAAAAAQAATAQEPAQASKAAAHRASATAPCQPQRAGGTVLEGHHLQLLLLRFVRMFLEHLGCLEIGELID